MKKTKITINTKNLTLRDAGKIRDMLLADNILNLIEGDKEKENYIKQTISVTQMLETVIGETL